MKRLQPFHYIILLAGLFLLAGTAMFAFQQFSTSGAPAVAIDPQDQNRENALYDLWFSSTNIYDISIDNELTGILFSTGHNTVSLLDNERRLLWDKLFSSAPRQAKLSSCGCYIVVGTAGGRLFFFSIEDQTWWDREGNQVNLVALSPSASWIAVNRIIEEGSLHSLELYNQQGELKWAQETEPLLNLHITSEFLEQGNIFYTADTEEGPITRALDLEGKVLWQRDDYTLSAITRHGSRLALVGGGQLQVLDTLGDELFQTNFPFDINRVLFNPYNYNRFLAYGSREGSEDNFFYYDLANGLVWSRRIADGSLFAFSADGQYIITSSWRHYKDDYTQMFLLDRNGLELNTWEVAMRVEHLLVSGDDRFIVLGSEDGYIDLINLDSMLQAESNGPLNIPIYSPVSTIERTGEKRIRLYFSDENSELVPVTRTTSITDTPIRTALEELIRGPARGSYLYRTIPDKEATIDVITGPEPGSITLDISPELAAISGTAQTRAALKSLLMTVSAFTGVERIYLTVNSEPLEVFGDGMLVEQPMLTQKYSQPVFVPIRSGERYYLTIQEAGNGPEQDLSLKELVSASVESSKKLHFVPENLQVVFINETPEQVQIYFNEPFKELFPGDGDEESYLLAALILDAIYLTVFENTRPQRVILAPEGEKWLPPEGYPSLSRFYRQPYFINPE